VTARFEQSVIAITAPAAVAIYSFAIGAELVGVKTLEGEMTIGRTIAAFACTLAIIAGLLALPIAGASDAAACSYDYHHHRYVGADCYQILHPDAIVRDHRTHS